MRIGVKIGEQTAQETLASEILCLLKLISEIRKQRAESISYSELLSVAIAGIRLGMRAM